MPPSSFTRVTRAVLIVVVPPVPSSPDSQGRESIGKGTAYYRPSLEAVLRLVKAKVDMFATPENWECFDHNVRSLNRDGLLAEGVDPALVQGSFSFTSLDLPAQF